MFAKRQSALAAAAGAPPQKASLNLAPVVVNELNIVGSRCGPFQRGLQGLLTYDFPLERLIKGQYPLDEALAAFAHAARPDALKVLIEM